MALSKSTQLKTFIIDGEVRTISITIDTIVTDDVLGEIARRSVMRLFEPGDINIVKAWTGIGDQNPYIVFLNALWTPAVIAAWQAAHPNN